MIMTNLYDLETGQQAYIDGLVANGALRRRLLDLGLVNGTSATCLYNAPSGDPKAYFVRGTVIALRKEDAKMIYIKPMTKEISQEVVSWV